MALSRSPPGSVRECAEHQDLDDGAPRPRLSPGASLFRLAVQDLLDEIVEDEAVASGERLVERAGVAAVAQRQGREQTCRPSLGPALQRVDVLGFEGKAHDVVEERGRLPLCETQVSGTQLEQLAAGPQARHRQRRVGTRGDGNAGARRKVVEQERHHVVDFLRLDEVIVIERQRERPVETVQIVDQAHDDAGGHRGAVGLQECGRIDADTGFGKTTLLSQWLTRGQTAQPAGYRRVAWLSLTPRTATRGAF